MRPTNEVTATIYQQLGGHRFSIMTGARDFMTSGPATLVFGLPSSITRDRIRRVAITLDPDDTYSMRFFRRDKGTGLPTKLVYETQGVYNDMLASVFTRHTGLDTHL